MSLRNRSRSEIAQVSVVVPTLNEDKNIAGLIEKINAMATQDLVIEVVIVDDGSHDKTVQIVREHIRILTSQTFKMSIYERKTMRGLSSAILYGIKRASYDHVIIMDADHSHPPDAIMTMAKLLKEKYDLVIGSRYVKDGKIINWPLKRWLVSKIATWVARTGLNIKQKDPLSGYFALRRDILDHVEFNALGYKILMEILAKVPNIRIKEMPIEFRERSAGKSKMDYKTIHDFVVSVWMLYRHGKKIGDENPSRRFLSKSARFFTVGASGLALNMVLSLFLVETLSLWMVYGNGIGIAVSMTSNFILNKIWTFEDRCFGVRRVLGQYAKFVGFGAIGAMLQIFMAQHLNEYYNISNMESVIMAVLIAAMGNFLLNKKFTFGEKIWE